MARCSHRKNSPETVTGIIEIPKNSRAKYELDKDSGLLILDRVLYSSINYPSNYSIIPQTYCDDGDPLVILVLSLIEIVLMCLVEPRPIGVIKMLDEGESYDKMIAVAVNDMSVGHIQDVSELPNHSIKELRSFFEDYKKLEKKEVILEEFQGASAAREVIEKSILDYKKLMSK
ncbi:inorganic diphosphatase [Vicingaceae bacterium]|nr:inorganic diphosphatase [Vicingaceae bacterium]MDB4060340.1 inorganic diphosphatase [Vicingaceae bacterium]MDC1451031.1 inorganic diphosphatase [Vicingaceae bacterium]